jgi:hypothetical protein
VRIAESPRLLLAEALACRCRAGWASYASAAGFEEADDEGSSSVKGVLNRT